MNKYFFPAACLLLAFNVHAQTLSKAEQKIISNIDVSMPATLELLAASVNINSGTFNIDGVKKTGALYAKELAALGFTVTWVTGQATW
jgi:glutamate carboxypeptidase